MSKSKKDFKKSFEEGFSSIDEVFGNLKRKENINLNTENSKRKAGNIITKNPQENALNNQTKAVNGATKTANKNLQENKTEDFKKNSKGSEVLDYTKLSGFEVKSHNQSNFEKEVERLKADKAEAERLKADKNMVIIGYEKIRYGTAEITVDFWDKPIFKQKEPSLKEINFKGLEEEKILNLKDKTALAGQESLSSQLKEISSKLEKNIETLYSNSENAPLKPEFKELKNNADIENTMKNIEGMGDFNKRRKSGRPLMQEAEKRDRKFTFNTTKSLAQLIEYARIRHNEEFKHFGVKLDESKFLEYIISTHEMFKNN